MKRVVVGLLLLAWCCLLEGNRVAANVFATATAGNAESPGGNDFQQGISSTTVSASSTDPEFGTSTADGLIVGPSLTYTGFAASFAGPAWIANASLDWSDTLYLTFPAAEVNGPTAELTVEFIANFSWDIDSNGSYDIEIGGRTANYSTAAGQEQDDFGVLSGSGGVAQLSVVAGLETLQLDPDNNMNYLATVGLSMQLIGHAGSGDWQHGSFPTAFATHSLSLMNVIIHDGETEIEPLVEFGADLVVDGNADFDEDGDVDGHDFLTWQRGFGILGGAELSDGDANADGVVAGDDLAVWQVQYGTPGPLAAAVTVPEPASTTLIAIALGTAIVRRRRRG